MKWMTKPFKGSELLYVVGWNEDRVRAHRSGMLRIIVRNPDPNNQLLMENDLRPVTSTGIGYLLKTVATNMRKAIKAGVLTFTDRGKENIYGRDTQVIDLDIPYDKAKDYLCARCVINQDVKSKILLTIRVYDRDGLLVENYGYEDLDLGARLSDADFDPKNLDYDF